jgi:hypothetical protein
VPGLEVLTPVFDMFELVSILLLLTELVLLLLLVLNEV